MTAELPIGFVLKRLSEEEFVRSKRASSQKYSVCDFPTIALLVATQ